jgi:hypothetical protein
VDETGLSFLDVLTTPADATPISTLAGAWEAYQSKRNTGASPFSSAVLVASRVDRLGFAFAVGYPAALQHMVDRLVLPSALCVTEASGNSPRSIESTLEKKGDGYELRGTKTFVTFGNLAKTLLVVAKVGDKSDGRPDLAVVRIPSDRDGVFLQELPKTPFVPEVPHTSVRFDGVEVRADERLPGDGYLEYVKPFRTIEDIHVIGSALAYIIGLSRRTGSSETLAAELSADLAALDRLRGGRPLDPRVHVALHGVHRRAMGLAADPAFAEALNAATPEERARWERDRALLRVASKARDARFERAVRELT